MSDHWGSYLMDASYGDVPLDIAEVSADRGRILDIAEAPNVDGAVEIQDMGARTRIDSLRLVFFQTTEDASPGAYLERYQRVIELKDSGQPQVFVHPLHGRYLARIADWREVAAAEPRNAISVECTMVEERFGSAVYESGAGAPDLAGLAEVDNAGAALVEAEPESQSLVTEVVDTVKAWTSGAQVAARDVELAAVTMTRKLNSAVDTYQAITDIKRWSVYRSIIALRGAMNRAAIVVLSTSPRIIEVRPVSPIPLRVLVTRMYGARQAPVRYEEMMRLNKIRNPARLEPGVVLKAQSPASDQSAGQRSVA